MGNLNRGANKVLVNKLDASIFGEYQRSDDSVNVLMHKPTGIAVPYVAGKTRITYGTTYHGNKESMVLDLNIPYPSDTNNFDIILNLRRDGRKQGWIDSHRTEARAYGHTIGKLASAEGTQVAAADKLTAMASIVMQINTDKEKFTNAGMVWVVEQATYNSTSTVVITLGDGTEYTVSTATTGGLAAAINGTNGLKDYVVAYGPATNVSGVTTVIVKSKVPGFFAIKEDTNSNIKNFYLELKTIISDFIVVPGAGQVKVMWNKAGISIWNVSLSECVDGSNDANIIVTAGGGSATLSPTTNTNNDTKGLGLTQKISTTVAGLPSSMFTAASYASDVVSIITVGGAIESISPATSGTDKAVGVEMPVIHKWSRLTTKDMNDIFPNGPENAFQYVDLPVQNADYALLDIQWDLEHYDNVIVDGIIQKRGHVQFYILKSELPTALGGEQSSNVWDNSNYMNDEPESPNKTFVDLITAWSGAGLTDNME